MMSTHSDTVSIRKEIQHFSHEHPLMYTEDENPKAACSACGVALMSIPCYRCSQDCNFFLHQPCTELPKSLSRRICGSLCHLNLLPEPLHDNCNCEKCGNLCKNFTYKCQTREIFFTNTIYFHCQCIFPLEISIKHISHHLHSLMAVCKEASLVCDACGRKQTGTFFCCQKCSFYIHQECCLLPSIVKINNHHHLLSLNYSLSNFSINKKCLICDDGVSSIFGAYVCDYCDRRAHLHCLASTMEETAIVQASILPMVPDTFPSLIIRTLRKNREDGEVEDVKLKIEKCHSNHSSWVLPHQGSDIQLVCNACIQPIISPPPYYRCPQPKCDFLLHQFCANLPPDVKDYFREESRHFFSESSGFCSVFKCCMCNKQCNGFGYEISGASFDVECAAAPIVIKHESHGQHPLRLSMLSSWDLGRTFCCDGHGIPSYAFVYSCTLCNYQIHLRCAFLPKTVKHKFDEHPLDLIYNPTSQIPHEADKEKEQHYLCEFCEEDVKYPKFWFYYCGKCDQSFHVNCIPSTGKLSKIKFGYNLGLPRHVHDHPVILTRMLTMGSQRCGFCKKMIQGFVDDMAFHCSICDFWIHFECAAKISQKEISGVRMPYLPWKISPQWLFFF